MSKAWLALLASIVGAIAIFPYMRATVSGQVRPHVFSWTVWGLTTTIVFLAQLQSGGGYGAWAVGFSAVIAYSIAVLAFTKRSDVHIKRVDWVFFFSAISAIPLWLATQSALAAVIVVTIVDVLGFGPTIRKAHDRPESESAQFFALIVVRNVLTLLALERYSVTTVLFPIAIGTMASIVMTVVLIGRKRLRSKTNFQA